MNLRRLTCRVFDHSLDGQVPLGMTVLGCHRCGHKFLVRRGYRPRVIR